ncbi:MAG: hypothetical protein A3I01_17950 [Betaproteobacteria bacterium RIFCSPLOWO2_02_FULL_65_24]|nr:MAG: hypothetical protein A3I01_17950 [Betaproteobacteria bacterium RIFCSPLOWO2_02_FULL_65_24]
MSDAAGKALYDEKTKRIEDSIALRRPDRIPTAFMATFWMAKYGGISHRQLMYDYDAGEDVARRVILDLDPDMYMLPHLNTFIGPTMEKLGFKQLQWPGHGVGENEPYQYLDREYMKSEEFDEFIADPTGFYLAKYLPRVASAFEGFEGLPLFPGLHYTRIVTGVRGFASPGVRRAMATVMEAGEENQKLFDHMMAFIGRMQEAGYPLGSATTSIAPYDFFADYFRGAKGMMTDLFRRRDKLMEAMDKIIPFLLRHALAVAAVVPCKIVFIPIHWAPDRFMSQEQFKTVYWPSFKKLLLAMIDAGLIPMPLWEAECDKRLEIIGEDMPKGKMIYWFERTDIVRAKEVLGDVVCLRGNISPSVMNLGKPEEVDAACRHVIEKAGRDGGLILDCAFGVPDEAPIENVRTLYRSVKKWGQVHFPDGK